MDKRKRSDIDIYFNNKKVLNFECEEKICLYLEEEEEDYDDTRKN